MIDLRIENLLGQTRFYIVVWRRTNNYEYMVKSMWCLAMAKNIHKKQTEKTEIIKVA